MSAIWTPAQRAICAFQLGQPDEVPTFELEFQLSEEFFGISLDEPRLRPEVYHLLSAREAEQLAYDLADRYARVYGTATAYDIGGTALSGDPERTPNPVWTTASFPFTALTGITPPTR